MGFSVFEGLSHAYNKISKDGLSLDALANFGKAFTPKAMLDRAAFIFFLKVGNFLAKPLSEAVQGKVMKFVNARYAKEFAAIRSELDLATKDMDALMKGRDNAAALKIVARYEKALSQFGKFLELSGQTNGSEAKSLKSYLEGISQLKAELKAHEKIFGTESIADVKVCRDGFSYDISKQSDLVSVLKSLPGLKIEIGSEGRVVTRSPEGSVWVFHPSSVKGSTHLTVAAKRNLKPVDHSTTKTKTDPIFVKLSDLHMAGIKSQHPLVVNVITPNRNHNLDYSESFRANVLTGKHGTDASIAPEMATHVWVVVRDAVAAREVLKRVTGSETGQLPERFKLIAQAEFDANKRVTDAIYDTMYDAHTKRLKGTPCSGTELALIRNFARRYEAWLAGKTAHQPKTSALIENHPIVKALRKLSRPHGPHYYRDAAFYDALPAGGKVIDGVPYFPLIKNIKGHKFQLGSGQTVEFTGRVFGQGSASTVYEAKLTNSKGEVTTVAVKIRDHAMGADPLHIAKEIRNVQLAAREKLGGVQFFGAAKVDGRLAIVTNVTPGVDFGRANPHWINGTTVKEMNILFDKIERIGLKPGDFQVTIDRDGRVHLMDLEGLHVTGLKQGFSRWEAMEALLLRRQKAGLNTDVIISHLSTAQKIAFATHLVQNRGWKSPQVAKVFGPNIFDSHYRGKVDKGSVAVLSNKAKGEIKSPEPEPAWMRSAIDFQSFVVRTGADVRGFVKFFRPENDGHYEFNKTVDYIAKTDLNTLMTEFGWTREQATRIKEDASTFRPNLNLVTKWNDQFHSKKQDAAAIKRDILSRLSEADCARLNRKMKAIVTQGRQGNSKVTIPMLIEAYISAHLRGSWFNKAVLSYMDILKKAENTFLSLQADLTSNVVADRSVSFELSYPTMKQVLQKRYIDPANPDQSFSNGSPESWAGQLIAVEFYSPHPDKSSVLLLAKFKQNKGWSVQGMSTVNGQRLVVTIPPKQAPAAMAMGFFSPVDMQPGQAVTITINISKVPSKPALKTAQGE